MRRFTVLIALVALVATGAVPALGGPDTRKFATQLSGDNEVPPVETDARGQVVLKLASDGLSIGYKLRVDGLEDIVQAHIHIGPADVNGPVTVFLFGPVPEGVTIDGKIAQGTITADDLIGPLAGQPLSALVDAITSGNAYANVHTLAHPMGEIRGQF